MCRVLGVTRSGYYSFQKFGAHKQDDPLHAEMLDCVKTIVVGSDYTYGSRRVKKAMNIMSYPISRNKARQLMKEAKVAVRHKRKFKVTTNSNHKLPLFDNVLQRQFKVEQPDKVYASDITYLVCDALTMAIWQRRPKAGLIHHSDRGSQYASHAFRKLLKLHGFKGSMSRKGDCWDNSVVESFFGTLKQERVHWRHYQTRFAAQQDILDYISMFYNSCRLHSYLDYKSPNQFENELMELKKVA